MHRDSPSITNMAYDNSIKTQPAQPNYPKTPLHNFKCDEDLTIFNSNNANATPFHQEKDKIRKYQNKAFKSSKNDKIFDSEIRKSPKSSLPAEDWKLLVVSGDELCSLAKKVSKSTLLPGRMEILGDMNNSSNERFEIRSDDSSTHTNEPQDVFLQEISQFPISSQQNLSSFLQKKYKSQTPENENMYTDILKRIIKYLHKSWLNQSMCDAIISTDNGDILTHQVILAAYSPTLESLFEQNRRPLPQFVQINMSDYPKDTIIDIINFLYTTNLKVDCKSVANLVAVARQLDLPEIINICGAFLTKNYDHDNIFLHYSVAANNLLRNSKNYLVKVIAMNFSLLVHHNHFLYIPIDRLNEILSHEALSGEELDILLAVIKWIDFSRHERIQFSKQLFSHIRFELVDPEAIANQVEIHDWLFADKANKELISEAYKYHALVGLNESSKGLLRNQKQQQEVSLESCADGGSKEEFSGRSLTSRRVVGINGSNNRTWNAAHHDINPLQHRNNSSPTAQQKNLLRDADCHPELERENIHFLTESPSDRLKELYKQQRQIQQTQMQLEKMQRQLLEQALQSGSVQHMRTTLSAKELSSINLITNNDAS